MSRKPRLRQNDVTKAVKGLTLAGVGVTRVEIEPNGKIIITTSAAGAVADGETPEDVKRLL